MKRVVLRTFCLVGIAGIILGCGNRRKASQKAQEAQAAEIALKDSLKKVRENTFRKYISFNLDNY